MSGLLILKNKTLSKRTFDSYLLTPKLIEMKNIEKFIKKIDLTYELEHFVYELKGIGYSEYSDPDLNDIKRKDLIEVLDYLKSVEDPFLSEFPVSEVKFNDIVDDFDTTTISDIDESIKTLTLLRSNDFDTDRGFVFEYMDIFFIFTMSSVRIKEFEHIGSKYCKFICLN